MDIVHLIEAKIVQSTQDHSSYTYADMEQSISLDHSEGNHNIHFDKYENNISNLKEEKIRLGKSNCH